MDILLKKVKWDVACCQDMFICVYLQRAIVNGIMQYFRYDIIMRYGVFRCKIAATKLQLQLYSHFV